MKRLRPPLLAVVLAVLALPAWAERAPVPAEPGALAAAIAGADPGDTLILAPGRHDGPVILDRPLTLEGEGAAILDGGGAGSVITVMADDVTIRGLEIVGSGDNHPDIDSGIKIGRNVLRTLVEDNRLIGNHVGIHLFGSRDSMVRGNTVIGRELHRMNDRGNGIYVWNAPGAVIEGNDIRFGRDGIFVNTSRQNVFRDNLMRDLRFAVHFMYSPDSEIIGNISVGNTMGFAIMFSDRVRVIDNLSLVDRTHGVMMNFANSGEVRGNYVRGGTHEKCTFIYNSHRNIVHGNRFEGCEIGIHFTAGSERNAIFDNAFVGNQTQVKYVGSTDVEWSHEGRGNFWSDHVAFDLNGDGIADSRFRPNDLMDHILWSQPSARLLIGSPAVQLIRHAQADFPATLPGGVLDSAPRMRGIEITIPPEILAYEAQALDRLQNGPSVDEEFDPLERH
ncbi:MAG: nitrous oxide reductase family maturation protein NosD [Roseicyclus sp.]|nr:nitrous oxide reductase family maturation protein NosD [Roseicyclus sp.]MBO6923273.1 nitrous oxide reductase family maturation protein NosD [Roseicyclus sp.]